MMYHTKNFIGRLSWVLILYVTMFRRQILIPLARIDGASSLGMSCNTKKVFITRQAIVLWSCV